MLEKKLQLKPSQTIALLGDVISLEIASPRADVTTADALLVFAINELQLRTHLGDLLHAANNSKLTWIAYPKAGQLNTDLNRDKIRAIANENQLDPVRQIAIDEVWSALRLKSIS